jgi:FkbM family methyltransferase
MGNLPISENYPGYFGGDWSVELHEFPSWSFMKNHVKNNTVFLDIGCQKGIYSKAVLEMAGNSQVYGFDVLQFPEIKRLEELFSNFKFIHSAVGDGQGANCKICYDKNTYFYADRTITIDEWMCENPFLSIDLIKIDVDGLELDVLRGAVMVEIESDVEEILKFLLGLGYKHFQTRNDINFFFRRE